MYRDDVCIFTFALQVVQEYERAVIFRLGRLLADGSRGPGTPWVSSPRCCRSASQSPVGRSVALTDLSLSPLAKMYRDVHLLRYLGCVD